MNHMYIGDNIQKLVSILSTGYIRPLVASDPPLTAEWILWMSCPRNVNAWKIQYIAKQLVLMSFHSLDLLSAARQGSV